MGTIRKFERAKGVVYNAQIRIKGVPPLSETFSTRKKAAAWITQQEAKIELGQPVSKSKLENVKIGEILQSYIGTFSIDDGKGNSIYKKGLNKGKEYRIGFLDFHLGKLTVKTLTHERIQKFFDILLVTDIPPPANRKTIHKLYKGAVTRKYSPATVRKYYYDLKTILEWWAFKHNFELGNRFQRQNTPENWIPRERRISADDEKKLYTACEAMIKSPEQWRQLIQLGLETALRVSELIRLKNGAVFLEKEKRYIAVMSDTNKMKENRSVPLSKKAVKVLNEIFEAKKKVGKVNSEERVFNLLPIQTFSASFKKITHRANLDIVAGDMRHEALCRLFENTKLTVVEIALMSGHSSVDTLKSYVMKLRPSFLADKLG